MREQMILDEKLIGVELTGGKKQFKWPVNDTEKKSKDNDDDDNESNDEMSALQKILVVHSVSDTRFPGNDDELSSLFRLFWAWVPKPINEI